MRYELPEQCLSTLKSTGELIIIKKGVSGYYPSEWNSDNREENENMADYTNRRLGVTPAQLEAMICGSMHGWNVPGANPQVYLDIATREKSVEITGHVRHPILSIHYPVKGYLHTYRIMEKKIHYIDFSSMPKHMLEVEKQFTYCVEMAGGKPMLPVTYTVGQNGSYNLILEDGTCTRALPSREGYNMVALTRVGNTELTMGYCGKSLHKYTTWEREIGDPLTAGAYYCGNYCEHYNEAVKNYENRIAAAYSEYCRTKEHQPKKQKEIAEKER